jgi:hypothetical protein
VLWSFGTGNVFAELNHPLYDGKVSTGLKAIGELPVAAWLQIIAAIAVVELTVGKQDEENKVSATRRPKERVLVPFTQLFASCSQAPGDLGFGYAFNPFKVGSPCSISAGSWLA